MKVLVRYLQRNKTKVKSIFENNCKNAELPATQIFSFLQQVLAINQISFTKNGKEFFKSEDNQGKTEKIIQLYYKSTPDGKDKKFFLYRITFSYEQFIEYLMFWLDIDKEIVVHDPVYDQDNQPGVISPEERGSEEIGGHPLQNSTLGKTQEINLPPELRESVILDNEFIMEEQKKSMLIAAYQGEVVKMEDNLLRVSKSQEAGEIQTKIDLLRNKIKQLTKSLQGERLSQSKSLSKGKSFSSKKPKTQGPKSKKPVNFKVLFEFYAKQNNLTGVKASFERIEHQSQTINYQKLVHFLKEYDIFPEKAKLQKQLHNLYVRKCSTTRDLPYPQFMELLAKLPPIVIPGPQIASQSKYEMMMARIEDKHEKHKVLHNPFHSHEKDDFRVDKAHLHYEFKLKPLKGKLISEVNFELEERKKQKSLQKAQSLKDKELQKMKKLKKLMAIDPYHPLVVKNPNLVMRMKSSSEIEPPVANIDNMERFRDASFDMKARFGIVDFEEDPLKQVNRYDVDKRLELIEREESLKMSSLMSGLIERSEAKLARLGLSPRKKRFSKLN